MAKHLAYRNKYRNKAHLDKSYHFFKRQNPFFNLKEMLMNYDDSFSDFFSFFKNYRDFSKETYYITFVPSDYI